MHKPSYHVPSMKDIAVIPWNGLTVISTFSGCGGSCLGYRMAGFKVVWANEFIPIAQASYQVNAAPDSLLNGQDIRQVQAADILAATGLAVGELDVLDGSPPCQAFSMAGKRAKGWGKERTYEHGVRQKNETLFTEYIRLVRHLQPKVFVAENVSGLVKGVAKGFFKEILRDLKACGYQVEVRMLDAQWLGVPQQRQRIIFQGVRTDLNCMPAWPRPLSYRYSVRDALPWLASQAIANGVYEDASVQDARTVMATTGKRTSSTLAGEHLSYVEARVMNDTGGFVRNKDVTNQPCSAITNGIEGLNSYHYQVRWDDGGTRTKADVTDRPARTERSGRAGTLFLEGANGFNGHAETSVEHPMPTVQAGRPVQDVHRPADGLHLVAPSPRGGHGFNVQDVHPEQPCGTVTTASPGNDLPVIMGTQRRKFTIAELKRICAFPDDFVLVGSYSQRWERLGNAVPPVMMKAIAEVIRDQIFLKMNEGQP